MVGRGGAASEVVGRGHVFVHAPLLTFFALPPPNTAALPSPRASPEPHADTRPPRRDTTGSPTSDEEAGELTLQNFSIATVGPLRATHIVTQYTGPIPLPREHADALLQGASKGKSQAHSAEKVALRVAAEATDPPPQPRVATKFVRRLLTDWLARGGAASPPTSLADAILVGKGKYVLMLVAALEALIKVAAEHGIDDVADLTPEAASTYVDTPKFRRAFDAVKAAKLALDVQGALEELAHRVITAATADDDDDVPADWIMVVILSILARLEEALLDLLPVVQARQVAAYDDDKKTDARPGDKRTRAGAAVAAAAPDAATATPSAVAADGEGPSSSDEPFTTAAAATRDAAGGDASTTTAHAAHAAPSPTAPLDAAADAAGPSAPAPAGAGAGAGAELDVADIEEAYESVGYPLLSRPGGTAAKEEWLVVSTLSGPLGVARTLLQETPAAMDEASEVADLALDLAVGVLLGRLGQLICFAVSSALGLPLPKAAAVGASPTPTDPITTYDYMDDLADFLWGSYREVGDTRYHQLPPTIKDAVAGASLSEVDTADNTTAVVSAILGLHTSLARSDVEAALGALTPGSDPVRHLRTAEGMRMWRSRPSTARTFLCSSPCWPPSCPPMTRG